VSSRWCAGYQVTRLACVYALLDQSAIIRRVHLEAALAVWKYAAASAQFVFGEKLGNPVADEVLVHLRAHPEGLTRTALQALFQRHKSYELRQALPSLVGQNLAYFEKLSTDGRAEERWFAKDAKKVLLQSIESEATPSESRPVKFCGDTIAAGRTEEAAKPRNHPPFLENNPDKSQAACSDVEAVHQQRAEDNP